MLYKYDGFQLQLILLYFIACELKPQCSLLWVAGMYFSLKAPLTSSGEL